MLYENLSFDCDIIIVCICSVGQPLPYAVLSPVKILM